MKSKVQTSESSNAAADRTRSRRGEDCHPRSKIQDLGSWIFHRFRYRQSRIPFAGLWTLLLTASAFAAEVDVSKLPSPAARTIDFVTDIKPIFEGSCFRCHGGERPK